MMNGETIVAFRLSKTTVSSGSIDAKERRDRELAGAGRRRSHTAPDDAILYIFLSSYLHPAFLPPDRSGPYDACSPSVPRVPTTHLSRPACLPATLGGGGIRQGESCRVATLGGPNLDGTFTKLGPSK